MIYIEYINSNEKRTRLKYLIIFLTISNLFSCKTTTSNTSSIGNKSKRLEKSYQIVKKLSISPDLKSKLLAATGGKEVIFAKISGPNEQFQFGLFPDYYVVNNNNLEVIDESNMLTFSRDSNLLIWEKTYIGQIEPQDNLKSICSGEFTKACDINFIKSHLTITALASEKIYKSHELNVDLDSEEISSMLANGEYPNRHIPKENAQDEDCEGDFVFEEHGDSLTSTGSKATVLLAAKLVTDPGLKPTICSGAFINSKQIVTAAHCVTSGSKTNVEPASSVVYQISPYRSSPTSELDRNNAVGRQGTIKAIYYPSEWNPEPPRTIKDFEYDIAILEVTDPGHRDKYIPNVQINAIFSNNRTFLEEELFKAIGYGKTGISEPNKKLGLFYTSNMRLEFMNTKLLKMRRNSDLGPKAGPRSGSTISNGLRLGGILSGSDSVCGYVYTPLTLNSFWTMYRKLNDTN